MLVKMSTGHEHGSSTAWEATADLQGQIPTLSSLQQEPVLLQGYSPKEQLQESCRGLMALHHCPAPAQSKSWGRGYWQRSLLPHTGCCATTNLSLPRCGHDLTPTRDLQEDMNVCLFGFLTLFGQSGLPFNYVCPWLHWQMAGCSDIFIVP